MSWLFRDWLRVLIVAGLVSGTTGYVWIKVQMSEAARRIESASERAQSLRVEFSRLQAAADLATRPGLMRQRAADELGLVAPGPEHMAKLFVGGRP